MLIDNSLRVYRLGLWYGSYRVFLAIGIFLIFILNLSIFQYYYKTDILFKLVLVYLAFSVFQFMAFSFYSSKRENQLLLFGSIDIIFFSIISLNLGQVNNYIGLLFVVTIFIINLVLRDRMALFLTVSAIIATIYPTFINSLNERLSDTVLFSSLALCFLFVVMCGLARFLIKIIENLEGLNTSKSLDLERSQMINSFILEKVDKGYFVLTDEFRVLLLNPAAKTLLGLEKLNTNELQSLKPEMFKILKAKSSQSDKFVFDFFGDNLSLQISYQKLELTHQKLILIGVEDINILNERVQSLKLAALGQLSASIAHEIRNPLAIIVQASSLLNGSSPEDIERFVGIIQSQSGRINKIITSTLNVAKNTGFNPEVISLRKFFEEFLTVDVSDISAMIDLNILDDVKVLFDSEQLKRVFINLVRNAVRHNSPNQMIKINSYLDIVGEVVVDIIDYGEGVEDSKIKNLFTPFFTTSVNGTGLGLYLCKNLCDLNHAKIEYVSISFGACFRIKCKAIT